jgi:hypothetical protein
VAKFATLKLNFTEDLDSLQPISAYDCSLRLCIKTWPKAFFQDSNYGETTPTELDFTKVTHRQPGQKPFAILEIDPALNATQFGTYYINQHDWEMMTEFLAAQFSYHGNSLPSNTDDQGVPIMLYHTKDMPATINKLADSLTNMIRTSADSYTVAGQAFRNETFIRIQWPWISLPVLVVTSSNGLLLVMMVQTWRKRAPVWKSSILALLFHGIDVNTVDLGNLATRSLSEMELVAERSSVRFNGYNEQDLKFIGA